MDPLEYLIKDCWRHLFKFLSAEDKQALCDTCETFHAMLQPEKVNWGFELILPHVTKYLPQYNPSSGCIKGDLQLSFNLKTRLVCKSWRATIDKVCGSGCWLHSRIQNTYDFGFSRLPRLEKFLNFFKNHRGNPIIGRSVIIYGSSAAEENLEDVKVVEEPEVNKEGNAAAENDENDEYERRRTEWERRKREEDLKNRKLVMELLLRYGEEIADLSLQITLHNGSSEAELDACKYLQLVLCQTPNLQCLKLSLHDNSHDEAILEYFALNPLPRLPKLRELTLYQKNPKIAKLLLEAYGENLQILRIWHSVSEIPLSVWSNMKCLKKLKLCFTDFASNVKLLQALRSPLEILSIREVFQRKRDLGQFFIDKFLLAVQHLPLRKIRVHPTWDSVTESAPFPPDFPKLFTITEFIFQDVRTTSLTFLQFLPNLQKQVIEKDIRINKLSFLPKHISKNDSSLICQCLTNVALKFADDVYC